MNFLKQFLPVFSVFVASTTSYSSLAAADTAEKVLMLSVGPSDLNDKDVPKLSLSNGPLAPDEKTIGVAFDKDAFAELFADKVIERGGVTYREARNFRDAKAIFKLKQIDAATTVNAKTFSLEPNAPAEGIIESSELLLGIDAEVTVQFDVYLCFTANNDCVFEKTSSERLRAEKGGNVFVGHRFQLLLQCYSLDGTFEIRGSIDHPELLYIMFPWGLAIERLKLNQIVFVKSNPVLNGAEFGGFTNSIGEFDVPSGYQGGTLKVVRENHKLRVERDGMGGGYIGGAVAENCVNYP